MTQDAKLDPFDLESLVLSQSFADTAGVKKLLTTVLAGVTRMQTCHAHAARAYGPT